MGDMLLEVSPAFLYTLGDALFKRYQMAPRHDMGMFTSQQTRDLIQCWLKVGLALQTMAQRWINMGECLVFTRVLLDIVVCHHVLHELWPAYLYTHTSACYRAQDAFLHKLVRPNVGLLLGQRRRRWANSKPTLGNR